MQHKYTHAAIIIKYENGLSIIRFDYNRVAVHLLACVFMVLIPIRFDYNYIDPASGKEVHNFNSTKVQL